MQLWHVDASGRYTQRVPVALPAGRAGDPQTPCNVAQSQD